MKTIIEQLNHEVADFWKEGWPAPKDIWVDVSGDPTTGNIVMTIAAPDFGKEKVFFLASHHPVLTGTPTANAIMYRLCSIRRRVKRVTEHMHSLSHANCLDFLGYKEKQKKGKKNGQG